MNNFRDYRDRLRRRLTQVRNSAYYGDSRIVDNANPEGCNQYKSCDSASDSASEEAKSLSKKAEQSGKLSDHQKAAKAHSKASELHKMAERKADNNEDEDKHNLLSTRHKMKKEEHESFKEGPQEHHPVAIETVKSILKGYTQGGKLQRPDMLPEHMEGAGQDRYFNDNNVSGAFKNHKIAGKAIRAAYEDKAHLA